MQMYQKLSIIGEGTYGQVFKMRHRTNGRICALKKIKLEQQDEGIPSTALREISILKELDSHPAIVKLEHVDYNPVAKSLHLYFQYADYDLKRYLAQHKHHLTPIQICKLMHQLISGVEFCHSKRIIHRDLKPQNLLIDHQSRLKIADFGLARAFSIPIKTLTHEIETLWYRAPEVLLGQKQYSLGVDIWAVGCIFAQLVEKRPLFCGDSEIDQIFKIFQYHGTPSSKQWANITQLPDMKPTFPKFKRTNPKQHFKHFDELGLDLLSRMIDLDPIRRISMRQALRHPYFQTLSMSVQSIGEQTRVE